MRNSRPTATPSIELIEIRPLTYDDPRAIALLNAYADELEAREPGVFDLKAFRPETGSSAAPRAEPSSESATEPSSESSTGPSSHAGKSTGHHSAAEAHVEEFVPPKGEFLGAFVDGELLGVGGVRCFERTTVDGDPIVVAEIKRMFVASRGRGWGLGRRILDGLEDAAVAFGAKRARLDTRSVLVEAATLYRSNGYELIARYNDNPFAQDFYEKRLDDPALLDGHLRRFALAQGLSTEMLPSAQWTADRLVDFDGPLNFRDLGGYRSESGGTVKPGVLFRSDQLSELSDHDLEVLHSLNVRTVHDFRLEIERERQPTRLANAWVPKVLVLSTSDSQSLDVSVIEIVGQALRGERPLPPATWWADNYDEVLEAGRPMFVQAAASIAEGEGPALFHCTGGKDRTGIMAVLLLRILRIGDETIIDDFLLTNLFRTPVRLAVNRANFARTGVDPLAVIPILGVTKDGIDRILDLLNSHYGGAERYLIDGGLEPHVPHALRDRFLQR